jgi:hypothetical protein
LNRRSNAIFDIVGCILVFALLCLRTLMYQYTHIHQLGFVDDAFYYFVVAQHIAQDGMSTFDGITLTNGYHPLWMALLTLQLKIAGPSLLLTRCVEYLLGGTALVFALLCARLPNRILKIFFTVGFFAILSKTSFNGMETALFACCFSLFTFASDRHGKENLAGGVIDGILAVAVIASRIDAVLFVLPQLFFAAKSWRRRVVSLAIVGACGGVYACANQRYFGIAMPISGEVKSLGGLQANWTLFRFLGRSSELTAWLWFATGLLFLLALFLLRKPRPYVSRPVVAGFLAGYALFVIRLAFLSSWVIWPWYNYPLIIGYIACVPWLLVMLENGLRQRKVALKPAYAAAVIVLFVVVLAGLVKTFKSPQRFKLDELSAAGPDLPRDVVEALHGSRVAMGDRAGNFAYHYQGSVNQMEGLVNDVQYFRMLRDKKNARDLLCERGIRFVVAYERDLTDYKVHLVHTIRPELSQYAGPEIEVSREDQVARVADLSPARPGGGWPYLYVWRLRCEVKQGVTVGSAE